MPRWHHEYSRPGRHRRRLQRSTPAEPVPRSPDLGPHRRHRRIGHAGGRREGQGAQGGRPAGDRVRRRRARLPDAGLHRRGGRGRLLRCRPTTATPRPPACPRCARRSRRRPCGTPATRSTPDQVLITNGGKQAVYQAFATLLDPGDEVLLPAPYWTTYPEAIALAGGVSVPVVADETAGYLVTHRPARGRADPADQGAAVLLAVEPDRRRLPAGAGRGDRPLGRREGHLGDHRRDLRAPGLRRRAARLDAGGGAGDRRPLHRGQRRGQDLRDDRLAGRLDDRPEGRRSRRPRTCSRT